MYCAQTGGTGFHLALVVFAAIQVHETKAALVRPNPQSIIVSFYYRIMFVIYSYPTYSKQVDLGHFGRKSFLSSLFHLSSSVCHGCH
jgi:hypothetical protein